MMKNKNLLIGLCSVPLLLSISTNMIAQDLRERTYYYEILEPRHEPKPEIKGFATERIKENLDRGLTATPSADGKGIDRKSTRLNSSHYQQSRMPSSA